MLDVIAFDADDTLWENNKYYLRARERYQRVMSKYQDGEVIEQRLRETQVANWPHFGWGMRSFGLSMVENAVSISAGRIEGQEVQEIIEITKEMLASATELRDHAEETLMRLESDYSLMLITMGDPYEQHVRLERSGLARYFGHVEAGARKSEEYYQALLGGQKVAPDRFLMVGDSLHHDVLPVLAIGGKAVYIAGDFAWRDEGENLSEADLSMIMELDDLSQLPEYIAGLNGSGSQ